MQIPAVADYFSGKEYLENLAPKGKKVYKISPSSIGKYSAYTTDWFNETVHGIKPQTTSDALLIGTCVHHLLEFKEVYHTNRAECLYQVRDYLHLKPLEESREMVMSLIETLADEAIRGLARSEFNVVKSKEEFIHSLVLETDDIVVYVAGSYDALVTDNQASQIVVRDYKTSNRMVSKISHQYKLQAFAYAYMLQQLGTDITHIENFYIIKPLKTIGPRTVAIMEEYTKDHHSYIKKYLEYLAGAIEVYHSASMSAQLYFRQEVPRFVELSPPPPEQPVLP